VGFAAILSIEQRQEIVGRDIRELADPHHSKPAMPHRSHRGPTEAGALLEVFESVNFTGANWVG